MAITISTQVQPAAGRGERDPKPGVAGAASGSPSGPSSWSPAAGRLSWSPAAAPDRCAVAQDPRAALVLGTHPGGRRGPMPTAQWPAGRPGLASERCVAAAAAPAESLLRAACAGIRPGLRSASCCFFLASAWPASPRRPSPWRPWPSPPSWPPSPPLAAIRVARSAASWALVLTTSVGHLRPVTRCRVADHLALRQHQERRVRIRPHAERRARAGQLARRARGVQLVLQVGLDVGQLGGLAVQSSAPGTPGSAGWC